MKEQRAVVLHDASFLFCHHDVYYRKRRRTRRVSSRAYAFCEEGPPPETGPIRVLANENCSSWIGKCLFSFWTFEAFFYHPFFFIVFENKSEINLLRIIGDIIGWVHGRETHYFSIMAAVVMWFIRGLRTRELSHFCWNKVIIFVIFVVFHMRRAGCGFMMRTCLEIGAEPVEAKIVSAGPAQK